MHMRTSAEAAVSKPLARAAVHAARVSPSACARAGIYSFPSHARLSDDAKDLISRMLCVDVDTRITMVEIQARAGQAVQTLA